MTASRNSNRGNGLYRAGRLVGLCWLLLLSSLPIVLADNQSQLVRAGVAKVSASVVRIRTIGDPGADDLSVSSQTTTGLVISEDGEILTSSFGFNGQPAAVFVEDSNGQRVAAKVVASDHLRKLVLLKCESGFFHSIEPAGERWPSVGATAIALGKFYPGTSPSVSVGVVSAVRRIHGLAIQTDAKISPVNYGGPLIGFDGRIMGLLIPLSPQDTDGISAGVEWYDSGIGFCIPLQDALQTAARLRAGKDLVHGRIGVGLSTRNPLASEFEITSVHPESPAASAGLKKGDVIAEANGVAIERFGHFEAVVKSSYAGESLRLVIERDGKKIDAEMMLVDRLKTPERGYFGLIPGDVVVGEGDNSDAVSVRVLPNSPAAIAGLPDHARITKWGENAVTKPAELVRALRLTFRGKEVAVRFRRAVDRAVESVSVTAAKRPDRIQPVADAVLSEVTEAGPEMEWARSEESLKDDLGNVWLYAPKVSPETESGVVILLSESGAPAETVLKKWGTVCERHNLILAVPSAAGEPDLNREHVSVVQGALVTAMRGRNIDVERVILVAEKRQAEICADLLFNPRAASLSAAAFVECWPRVAGVSQQLIARKSVSTLIQTGKIHSRQTAALQTQALAALEDAGVAMIRVARDDSTFESPEEQIALWCFGLKVR